MPSKGWMDHPEQLQRLDKCGPLVGSGLLSWAEAAASVSSLGPSRSANACQLRWRRFGASAGAAEADDFGQELLLAQQAGLKLDRAVWEQERRMVMNETVRLRKENTRLMALNNVVIRTFKEAVLQAVGGPYTVVATVMAKPNPWVDGLEAMPNVTLWEVTMENRDRMAEQVIEWSNR